MGSSAAGKKASDITAGQSVITTWGCVTLSELGTAGSDGLLIPNSPESLQD